MRYEVHFSHFCANKLHFLLTHWMFWGRAKSFLNQFLTIFIFWNNPSTPGLTWEVLMKNWAMYFQIRLIEKLFGEFWWQELFIYVSAADFLKSVTSHLYREMNENRFGHNNCISFLKFGPADAWIDLKVDAIL